MGVATTVMYTNLHALYVQNEENRFLQVFSVSGF
jgi:hypothetical protein